MLKQGALLGRERVETRREDRVHRLRQRRFARYALLEDAVHHLLGEERVASGALGHLGHQGVLDLLRALGEERLDELASAGRLERLEGDRRRVASAAAPAWAPVQELVAREADHEDGSPDPPRQILDQVEHPLVRPVDVLDGENDCPFAAGRFDECPDGREETGANLLRIVVLRALGEAFRDLDAERARESRGEAFG